MALKSFNSINGFSVGEVPANVIYANGDIQAANLNVSKTSNLGPVGNVKITGGSSGQYLQTDGTGNLSWAVGGGSGASIANGTSNVNIATANGNITMAVNGTANVVNVSSSNVNVSGTLNATTAIIRNGMNIPAFAYQSNTAPTSPLNGDQWYNTYNGILFEYLNDGTTSQWVDISSLPYPNVDYSNAVAVQTNLSSTGTVYAPFISSTANGNYSLISNTAYSANLANGSFNATLLGGTLTTAAQPNVTSLGILSSVSVSGNANVGNLGTSGLITATGNIQSTAFLVSANLSVSSNANIGNIGTGGLITAVGNIQGGNLVTGGQISATGNATVANLQVGTGVGGNLSGANYVSANFFTGTLTTAAQPNVTSLGILTTLSVSGNANLANLGLSGLITVTGNITGGNLVGPHASGNSNIALTANGNIAMTVAGNANIIVVTGTGANVNGYLSVSGNANIGNIGTAGIISATGNITGGNLIGVYANGNSTINIPAANGNINLNAGGSATPELIVTTTGANVNGYLSVSGNSNIGNIGTSGLITATGNIQGGNLVTGGVLSVSGNANVGNINVTGSIIPTANITYDLGNATNLFRDLYLSGATIKLGSQTISSNSSGINLSNTVFTSNLSVTGNANVGNIGGTNGIFTANLSVSNRITAGNGISITSGPLSVSNGNLDVTGNINVTGNLNYSNVTDLVVGDPLIYIGANNTGDIVDEGLVASYNNGTYQHTGLARNHVNSIWTFFDGVVNEPTTIIDWANAVYPTVKLGNLQATSTISATGNANVGNLGTTGVYATTLSSSGNANVGNLGSAGLITITGNITGGNLVTGGVLSVTGNANIGNIGTGGLITATGNITGANIIATSTTNATSTTTGAVIVSGGLGVAGNSYIGNTTIKSNLSYVAPNGANTITSQMLNGGTLAWSGNVGQLFSITDNMTGNIFSVNDVSGMPLLTANANGTVQIVYNANVGNLGTAGFITATGNITGGNLIGIFANGNSNISIPAANGNITIATSGSERARFDTSGNFLGQDNQQTRFMFKDTAYAYYDSSTTNALDYINGSNQRWAPNTGSQTLTITNWPPSGNLGELLIEGINLGASTITWPSINWINPNGTLTTSISTYLTAIGRTLQTSGTDFVLIWTRNAGTTLYGKLL